MLVHDIKRNETRVINFQGSTPELLREEMLQNPSEMKVTNQYVKLPLEVLDFCYQYCIYPFIE